MWISVRQHVYPSTKISLTSHFVTATQTTQIQQIVSTVTCEHHGKAWSLYMLFQLLKLLFSAQRCSKHVGLNFGTHRSSKFFRSKQVAIHMPLQRAKQGCPKNASGLLQLNRPGWMAATGIWTFNLQPKAKAKMAFQIFSNSEWVEILGKKMAVKLEDMEAGCIWEGVASKANNNFKNTSKYNKWQPSLGFEMISQQPVTQSLVFWDNLEYISSVSKHFHALSWSTAVRC